MLIYDAKTLGLQMSNVNANIPSIKIMIKQNGKTLNEFHDLFRVTVNKNNFAEQFIRAKRMRTTSLAVSVDLRDYCW